MEFLATRGNEGDMMPLTGDQMKSHLGLVIFRQFTFCNIFGSTHITVKATLYFEVRLMTIKECSAGHTKLVPTQPHLFTVALQAALLEYMTLLTQPWPQARAPILPCEPHALSLSLTHKHTHTHTHTQAIIPWCPP